MASKLKTVVIVEDDPGMRSALERVLGIAGFEVEAFSSAEQFLESDSAARADCLVCDISLPGISGFELGGRLTRAGSTMSVVFITALDSRAARDEARQLGAAAYLPKPFESSALVAVVRQATAFS